MNPGALEVLSVVASTDRRGAEVFAVDLGGALEARGHGVDTVALAPGPVGGLNLATLGSRAKSASTLRALRRRAHGADLVLAHGSTTLPACALALAGSQTQFVYRNIGDPRHWSSTGLRRARVRFALRRAAAVVAVAEGAREVLIRDYGVRADRVAVIPTAVDADRFVPATADERAHARAELGLTVAARVLAIVGALSAEKDVGVAIEALGLLDDVHLLVAGDGPERARLEQRAQVVAPGRVHFAGALRDARPVYAAADALVLTSRSEGLPAVLIEAGSSGLPVVATDVGFVDEVVVDGETGLLVPPDDPDALAAAVRTALDDRERLGRSARSHCLEHFALANAAAAYEAVLLGVTTR